MHDCVSILVSIAEGTSCFPLFFALCIPTSPFIHLNDFFTHFCRKCSYVHAHVSATPSVIEKVKWRHRNCT